MSAECKARNTALKCVVAKNICRTCHTGTALTKTTVAAHAPTQTMFRLKMTRVTTVKFSPLKIAVRDSRTIRKNKGKQILIKF